MPTILDDKEVAQLHILEYSTSFIIAVTDVHDFSKTLLSRHSGNLQLTFLLNSQNHSI